MASLKDLLEKTLLFAAARGAGVADFYRDKRAPDAPLVCPIPAPDPSQPPESRPVWHWQHDPSVPARVSALKALSRTMPGMMMPVCDRIEAERVSVTLRGGESFALPLTPAYVLSKYMLPLGTIHESSSGWWQLPTWLDPSLLVVFGYELIPGKGGTPKPLSLEKIESWRSFFPHPDVSKDDPDASEGPPPEGALVSGRIIAKVGEEVTCYVSGTYVVVAFGFAACKERADFEPGEVLGAGRIYPHVMVTCNQPLDRVETSIVVERPAKAMQHDPEMQAEMGAIFTTDTNKRRTIIPAGPPLPLWSNFFDYYHLSPSTGTEFVCVDPRRGTEREVIGAIQRENSKRLRANEFYETSSSFTKVPKQGAFDNLHIAPRMKFTSEYTKGLVIDDIAMAPFCIHDCLHTHFRWGILATPVPKAVKGFNGRTPYATDGSPLVPANQLVSVTLTSRSSFRYRATANGPIAPATWTVFFHHGSAYALAIADQAKFALARGAIAGASLTLDEPYTRLSSPVPLPVNPVMADVDPVRSIAAFYHRLQFTGTANGNVWMPRIKILDLDRCRDA